MSLVTKIALIAIFISAFGGILLLMPNAQPLPEAIANSLEIVVTYLYSFDFILPVDALITTFGLAIAFEFVLFGWRIFKYIIRIGTSLLGGSGA